MTSDAVFVWTHGCPTTDPVVAGRLVASGPSHVFNYGRSYLANPAAISLFTPELPLAPGAHQPLPGLTLPGCLRDGSPDGWGRRVIEHHLKVSENSLSEIDYMLASGSNRLGAIDFQESATQYVPRGSQASLDELVDAAELIQAGKELPPELDAAIAHGTTIGGARPKVLVRGADGVQWIAKLSTSSDFVQSQPNAEAMCLELARRVGIEVPQWRITSSNG
ncbi:hypothetical protein E2C04_01130 [Nocardioides daphniae]|uniref:Type II toxin-antitoxin system HipA family toxin n=1 Tax=Nocardioides daphniae TaxID=402297 RepID=A0A4P7UB55_9ACTN|nr:hypothetical protein E2C04_01130 [Nocardioides daphniae]